MQGFKFSGVALCIANLTEHLPLNIEIREKRYSLRKLNSPAASGGAKLHECCISCIKCIRFRQISHDLGRLRRTIERVQPVRLRMEPGFKRVESLPQLPAFEE